MMKKIIIILTILTLLLTGCSTTENKTINQTEKELSKEDYKAKIQKLTDKEIYKMIIEDFDNNGEKEAFVLTKDGHEKEESEFELWFLSTSDDEKLINTFIASDSTSIELLNAYNKYVLFNESQIRQNDDMQSIIYGVTDNKAVKLYSQTKMNLFVEKNELYAYDYSYSVLEPEFKEWMSLSEQMYHFKWDEKIKTCKEYEAKIISEDKFMEISQSEILKNKIYKKINNKYLEELKDIKYTYLLREDETLDINMIVTVKDGSKHKYYVTVPCKNNVLGTEIELFEGNKEESIIKYLNQ